MSEEETDDSEAATGSTWPGWVAVILGLWVIVTPFFLGGGSANAFNWLLWSNIVSGLLIAIFAGFVASR
jgi:hypothetical protein